MLPSRLQVAVCTSAPPKAIYLQIDDAGNTEMPLLNRPLLQSTGVVSLVVAAAGAFWGLWWIPLRLLERNGLAGNWANVVLNVAATLIVLPFALGKLPLTKRGLGNLLVIGLLAGFTFALWNHSLIYGNVVRVTLLFYLSPIWATAFGIILLRDPIGLLRVLSILLGLSGAAMVLDFHGLVPVPRNAAEYGGLVTGVSFALLIVYIRRTRDIGALEKTLVNSAFSVPFGLLFLAIVPAPAPTLPTIVGALPLILFCCIWLVPVQLLILWCAGRLDPGRITVLLLLEVLASAISAALLTDEPFGWHEFVGCILILGAGLVEGLDQFRSRPNSGIARPASSPMGSE
jgi:drug/metabolite transporter (DMT)-like permease